MLTRPGAALGAGFLLLAAGTLPATADNTGLEKVHQLKREGDKLCMVGHFHYGQADSDKSKDAAERQAIVNWANFVALEYGTDWWSWKLAADRSTKCVRNNTGYLCSVEGRPCRP